MTRFDPVQTARLQLVDLVLAEDDCPPDRWAVAVALETRGIRDVDARERFGASSVFELSADIFERCRSRIAAELRAPHAPEGPQHAATGRFVVCYGRGIFLALPMVVLQMGSIAGLQLSGRLTGAQATAVALGTVLSLVAAGGFVQAIGRLGHLYRASASYRLAGQVSALLMAIGFVAAIAVAGLFALASVTASLFPTGVVTATTVYTVLLAALWLALAVLYMLESPTAILIVVASWIGMLVFLFRSTPLGTYEAHWASIALAAVVAAALGFRELQKLARGSTRGFRLPPLPYLVRTAAPYLGYGVLYFSFLFADRVVAWLAAAPSGYVLFSSHPYELGMSWAGLSLVLTIALLNYTVHTFAEILIPTQKRFRALDVRGSNHSFERFYLRQLVLFGTLVVLSGVVTYEGVLWLRQFEELSLVGAFFGDTVTYNVVLWAILGYALLVWGLLNSVFLFFLSLPQLVLRSLAPALAVNVVVGVVLTQTGEYWESVLGLAAGAFVFAFLSTRYTIRVFRELDYHYYASC